MRIEAYFDQIGTLIEACPVVQSFNITYDKRSTYEGFIRGEVYFVDGSMLHLREFVDVEVTPERLTYVYQYMNASLLLSFRYDNTGHHRKLDLPTYPHHKHEGSEDNVTAASAPKLAEVLAEIESLIELTSTF
ncbi:MAG: toxin-antitoxin system TumE family protein [Anaerolineae bacterium]